MVAWASQPLTWPCDLGDGVILDRATFAFDSLRVVGDAGPGDPRTTATGFTVRWDDMTTPPAIGFLEAPTGLYSQVSLVIDGNQTFDSFDLRGHVQLDGTDWEFRIIDDNPLTLTLPMEKTLSPPGTAVVNLRVSFQRALDVIDYRMLEVDEGRLHLQSGDPQMDAFRTQLVSSFEVID